jgi:site-specific recombinase XerD
MASLRKNAKSEWEIRYYEENRERCSLYLGKISARSAEEIHRHVERMLEAKWSNRPLDETTAKWVGGIDGRLSEKLAAKGLIARAPRPQSARLGVFIEQYIEQLSPERASRTIINLRQARDKLLAFIPADREMGSVTISEMVSFRHWLAKACGLAPNSVKIHCRKAKQFFQEAVERGLIADNPCRTLKDLHEMRNEDRERFMTVEQTKRVLAACPSDEWRLIFSLARFGGLRKSEILALRWDQIFWDECRIEVPGAKGRHGTGKRKRDLPIFPELADTLRAVLAQGPDLSGRVVASYRPDANIGALMARHIKAAGIGDWQKALQNLRATRATELMRAGGDPAQVCRWLGHSIRVFVKHYDRMRSEDFLEAARRRTVDGNDRPSGATQGAQGGGEGSKADLPKSPPATARRERKGPHRAKQLELPIAANRVVSAGCASVHLRARGGRTRSILPTGIEPVTFSSGG